MTAVSIDMPQADVGRSGLRVDWPLVIAVTGALLIVVAALIVSPVPELSRHLTDQERRAISAISFALAITFPVIFAWRRAIRDNQLPAKSGLEPQYEHVSGWNAIFLALVVGLIAALVWWAAQGDDETQLIHDDWGMWVVLGLTIAFIIVAAAPLVPRTIRALRLEKTASSISSLLNTPADALGRALSIADSMLVFAVANAAGTNRRNTFLRYGLLLSAIGACAALGYWWPAPWAFVPIAWGFIVAFSISRRWAWIEQDRELAMLNSSISQAHIRVGFAQNLRDEALVAFLSMFLLVPLALRQSQLLADEMHVPLFDLQSRGADVDSVLTWISFYGTELAKAVPFVDWAEVYHVEGDAKIQAETDLARHVIFLTRVLIDLVFLAALLQAISSASRDAQQRDLFYRKQSIHRLDPFTEPDAFRSLVRKNRDGQWERNDERFDDFPRKYEANRLAELTASSDERVAAAANFLFERDGNENDPHYQLSSKAAEKSVSAETITEILDRIENSGPDRNPYQLALARRRLLTRSAMRPIRARIVSLITQSAPSFERTDRLIEALVGEHREGYQSARLIALEALAPDMGINFRIEAAIKQTAEHDGAKAVRERAKFHLQAAGLQA